MARKVVLALGGVALLATFTTAALADAITFSFISTKSTPAVAINNTGVKLGPAVLLSVSDTDTNTAHFFSGSVSLQTGPAVSYFGSGGVLSALFSAGPSVDVKVLSAACAGGKMPGVCLEGSQNRNGTYIAFQKSTGSFQGLFHVDYVSPYITALFNDPNSWLQPGSDSFTTSQNTFANGGLTDVASLGQGGITFQTVPEPGTLALIGTGILALATVMRRKMT